jgi:hypothetical protein
VIRGHKDLQKHGSEKLHNPPDMFDKSSSCTLTRQLSITNSGARWLRTYGSVASAGDVNRSFSPPVTAGGVAAHEEQSHQFLPS